MTPQIVAVDHFAGVGWGVAAHRQRIREYGVDNASSLIRIRSANGMRTIYRDVWSGLFHPAACTHTQAVHCIPAVSDVQHGRAR